jgi:hypothetical protein
VAEVPALADDVVYGAGRIDASGRVGVRAFTSALRRRCGLLPGDRVLLAMFPGQDAMAAYSFAVVDEALRAHSPLPRDEAGRS